MKHFFYTFAILMGGISFTSNAQGYIPQAVQLAHNSADNSISTVKVWVNDTIWLNSVSFQQATPKLSFASGTYTLGISLPSATAQAQSILQFTFDFSSGIDDHFLMLSGLSGNSITPLAITDYTGAALGVMAPVDSYYNFYNGCVNCGSMAVNASCTTAAVSTITTLGSLDYTGTGLLRVQTNTPSNTNHTLTMAVSSSTTGYGTFVLPLTNCFQRINNIIMNGAFNSNAKAAGTGFGLALVPVEGGSVTPLTKVAITTGINELINSNSLLEISPNPVGNELRIINRSNETGPLSLLVFDLSGKMILRKQDVQENTLRQISLDVQSLNKGVYLLVVKQGTAEKSMKFIKE